MKNLHEKNNLIVSENNGELIPLMERFYTIQGEGYHQGKASFFIRTAGCNVGCHWCDIKDSWDASEYPLISVDAIAEEANSHPMKIAVVTGGESMMFNMGPLTKALKNKGLKCHVETSGAYKISGEWDWICISPKKFRAPLAENMNRADELKVIVYNRTDFKWAVDHAKKVSSKCKLYIQPEWNKAYQIMPEIVDFIKDHPEWNISLQTHKYMNIP
jgi:organic radical activating enzyme